MAIRFFFVAFIKHNLIYNLKLMSMSYDKYIVQFINRHINTFFVLHVINIPNFMLLFDHICGFSKIHNLIRVLEIDEYLRDIYVFRAVYKWT